MLFFQTRLLIGLVGPNSSQYATDDLVDRGALCALDGGYCSQNAGNFRWCVTHWIRPHSLVRISVRCELRYSLGTRILMTAARRSNANEASLLPSLRTDAGFEKR